MLFYSLLVKTEANRIKNGLKLESSAQDGLEIQTHNGPVRGFQLNYDSKYRQTSNLQNANYSIRAWLGIPYAQKPLDDLRFKRPVAVNNWTEALNASKFEHNCLQPNITDDAMDMSEDCHCKSIRIVARG